MTIGDSLKGWATRIKRDALTLWFARKHADTPWAAKALGVFVVAYALSPIDLIPDFIPVLGILDDVILLPLLIWVAIRLLPSHVLADCRRDAAAWLQTNGSKPSSRAGAALVLLVWLGVGAALWFWLER